MVSVSFGACPHSQRPVSAAAPRPHVEAVHSSLFRQSGLLNVGQYSPSCRKRAESAAGSGRWPASEVLRMIDVVLQLAPPQPNEYICGDSALKAPRCFSSAANVASARVASVSAEP